VPSGRSEVPARLGKDNNNFKKPNNNHDDNNIKSIMLV
jgi:hypothetical protein